MYSVCKLDQPRPTGLPFTLSKSDGCDATSCPTAKPVCFSSQICCTLLSIKEFIVYCSKYAIKNYLGSSKETACVDTTGVTCTADLCAKKPGTYLKKCKKTCNNCDGNSRINWTFYF